MYMHSPSLTSAGASNKSEVVEASHLVLERGGGVAKLCGAVLVVSRRQNHLYSVANVAQRQDLERGRKGLVAPPVRGEDGTHEVGRARPHEFPWVLGENL